MKKKINTYHFITTLVFILSGISAMAQTGNLKSDGWEQTKNKKKGAITCLWYNIEPFIYRTTDQKLAGVEYELMEGFKKYLLQQYDVVLHINWVEAGAFEKIFPIISESKEKGLFGLSFFSITDKRKQAVNFSPPYMPDLNIVCTNNNLPTYSTDATFIKDLPKMKGHTQVQTTMEEDIMKLRSTFYPGLPLIKETDSYEVLEGIAGTKNAFGYVPLSIYVVALRSDIKIKRQRVLSTRREGFAAIYPKESDWSNPVNDYFNSSQCKVLVNGLVKKYLGEEASDLILSVSLSDTLNGKPSDIELLTKEREIVTQRLIENALETHKQQQQKVIYIITIITLALIGGILFNRFQVKQKLNMKLQQQNKLIAEQKERIEIMNNQLEIKILQSKLNPHFLFNSLNAIQFFVTENNNKATLQYINRFSQFLRNVLRSSDTTGIPAHEEIVMLEQYLWLEQSRFPGKFIYKINYHTDFDNCTIPPLVSIGMAEHVLYRSILNEENEIIKKLIITFKVIAGHLIITINDDGKQLEETNQYSQNLYDRLRLINHKQELTTSLTYHSEKDINISNLQIAQN